MSEKKSSTELKIKTKTNMSILKPSKTLDRFRLKRRLIDNLKETINYINKCDSLQRTTNTSPIINHQSTKYYFGYQTCSYASIEDGCFYDYTFIRVAENNKKLHKLIKENIPSCCKPGYYSLDQVKGFFKWYDGVDFSNVIVIDEDLQSLDPDTVAMDICDELLKVYTSGGVFNINSILRQYFNFMKEDDLIDDVVTISDLYSSDSEEEETEEDSEHDDFVVVEPESIEEYKKSDEEYVQEGDGEEDDSEYESEEEEESK